MIGKLSLKLLAAKGKSVRARRSIHIPTVLLLLISANTFAKSKETVVSISTPFGGSEIKVSARAGDGGAIYSLTWNGKEFLNSSDKGRDLQFAWDLNGYGEAFNPTEAGSHDDRGDSSTRFASYHPLSLLSLQGNLLQSAVHPAFWLKTSETSPNVKDALGEKQFQSNDTQPRGKSTTDDLLETRVRVGPGRLPPNVIRFEADITFVQSYHALDLGSPTGYLNSEFDTPWRFNPRLNILTPDVSNHLAQPKGFDFGSDAPLPVIVSTKDQQYAMGVFSDDYRPDQMYIDYSVVSSAAGHSPTTFWSINKHYGYVPKGQQTFVSFLAVGTLDDVKNALTALYKLHQYHLNDPRGYIEFADANHITGWVYDPRAKPGEALNMDVSTVDDSGNETVITTATTSQSRPDIDNALVLPQGTCLGFDIPLPPSVRDGQIHYLVTHVTSKDGFVRQFIPYPKAVRGQ